LLVVLAVALALDTQLALGVLAGVAVKVATLTSH
jgi:hypothetical protein